MTPPDSRSSRRPFPVAAGLVMLYVGIIQSGFAVSMLVQALSLSFETTIAIPAISLVVSLFGQIGIGYCAAARRSVAISVIVWIAGCLGTVYGFTLLEVTSLRVIAIGVLQLAGGPIAFALVARGLPEARTPARREIGALLLVAAIGHAFGTVWNLVSMVWVFGLGSMTVSSVFDLAASPAVTLIVSALAVRAALSLLDGRESAQRRLALWKWASIGTSCGLAVITFVSWRHGHDLPLTFRIQLPVQAALACVLPLALGRLGRGALAEPKDVHAVPTVYAWGALWLVPTLLCATVLTSSTFAKNLVGGDSVDESWMSIVGACCGLAAILLFATSSSVLRAHAVARLLGRITAALAVCALCYLIYAALKIEPQNYGRSMIPVGTVAMFTAAMIALAWFEARREQDLAPARVVG